MVPRSEDGVAVGADVQAPDLAVDLLLAVLDEVRLEADELRGRSEHSVLIQIGNREDLGVLKKY